MADFPTVLDEITPAFLSEVLGSDVSAVTGSLVAAQGAVSTAARLQLTYAPGAAGPPAVFAKWSAPIEAVRRMAAQNGMYRREIRFYKDLAATSDIQTPHCHFAGWDRTTDEFLLILEDMSASRVGNFYASALADVTAVVVALPPFHARWWNHPDLAKLRWLFPLDHPAASGGLQAAFTASLDRTRTRFPDQFDGALGAVSAAIVDRYPAIAGRFAARPVTLTHADLHLQQVFFPGAEGGHFAVFDWQTIGRGFGGQDLARIIAMSLTTDARREHERALVARYHQGLLAAGVREYDLAACWDDYRLGMIWSALLNVVAGASIDRAAMDADAAAYGTTLGATFFGRIDAALADLDVVALLP
ncbi:MAG: phosphotransferase [Chloroflexi bacterium]|nr:phosphotransferase [Chloroflexota bacterium]MDA1145598.1 phosphotransferase [Chloroflexota bacterium]